MGRALRNGHLWIAALIGIPILMWTVTGFLFTCFDFEAVRGAPDRAPAEEIPEARVDVGAAVLEARRVAPGARVVQVRTRALLGRAVHVVELAAPHAPIVVDGDGAVRGEVSLDEARRIATSEFVGGAAAEGVELVLSESDAPEVPRPAYRVRLADPRHTEVFVSQTTGEIVAWRNDTWRWFDRLWSLHVFGFVSRATPAHWALRIAGALAALAAATGVGLLVKVLARTFARMRSAKGPRGEFDGMS